MKSFKAFIATIWFPNFLYTYECDLPTVAYDHTMLDKAWGQNLLKSSTPIIGSPTVVNSIEFDDSIFAYNQSMLDRSWELKCCNLDIASRAPTSKIVCSSSALGVYSARLNKKIKFERDQASYSERIGIGDLEIVSSMHRFFSKWMPTRTLCRFWCKAARCPRDLTSFITFVNLIAIVAISIQVNLFILSNVLYNTSSICLLSWARLSPRWFWTCFTNNDQNAATPQGEMVSRWSCASFTSSFNVLQWRMSGSRVDQRRAPPWNDNDNDNNYMLSPAGNLWEKRQELPFQQCLRAKYTQSWCLQLSNLPLTAPRGRLVCIIIQAEDVGMHSAILKSI